nr:hypothetical protein [Tanacetum cinerariifolium]
MTSLADKAILSGADNRPPMLKKDMYDSWKSIIELFMLNKQHGRMILESVENGPLLWPTVEENGVTRPRKYSELSATKAIQADCDRECKMYDEFDKFAYKKGELPRDLYLRFSMLLNDMNIYNMKLEQFQVSMKFLNTLPPGWSKFVTDVKLVRDLHTTNIDQLHAYLGQHEYHANEYASQAQSSTPLSNTYPSNDFLSSVNHNVYNPSSSIPQVEYAPAVHQQSDFSQPDTRLVVPMFQKGDDPIDAINHMMLFLTVVVTSRYPPTNNQLRNSSNPRQQAAINNGIGNRGSLFVTTVREKAICQSSVQSQRGKEMRHGLRIRCSWFKLKLMDKFFMSRSWNFGRSRDSRDSKHTTELSGEQAFCSQNSRNSKEPNLSNSTTIVEVPKELPKVSMVNSSLKKLKF